MYHLDFLPAWHLYQAFKLINTKTYYSITIYYFPSKKMTIFNSILVKIDNISLTGVTLVLVL